MTWKWLEKNREKLLLAVLLLAAFLRLYHLGASGYGNLYYAAAVKSMLLSWKNFFFAAFEPGGSVSVDKPPLGFWVQALSAALFGLNGFALALPNALAGVFSVFLVYRLVRRPFGPWAGLAAALALALTFPVVTVYRDWVAAAPETGFAWIAFAELFLFTAILVVGLIWVWAHGDLEWVKALEKPTPFAGSRNASQDNASSQKAA